MVITDFVNDTEKFTLDGESSDEYGLFCDYLPPMPLAEQQYTTSNVGSDEMLTTPDEVFSDIKYQIRFYTFLTDDYNDMLIKGFCADKKILTLSKFPSYYFKIKRISLQAIDGSGYGKRVDYTLTLTLAPFRYSTVNPQITMSEAGNVTNTHTRYSKPEFTIIGTGDIALTVQGRTLNVYGLATSQTVVIDSMRHIIYSGNTYLTGKSSGFYPLFNVGVNAVSWVGNISSVKYRPNWRDY